MLHFAAKFNIVKIIQTFWPAGFTSDASNELLQKGGWKRSTYHWLSWTLSCLQLTHFYDHVELITNSLGKSILIDQLKLPYTSVRTDLDKDIFQTLPPRLWSLAKIYSYGVQDEPFLHVDGDVYIFRKFPDEIERGQLVAQCLEINMPGYLAGIEVLNKHFYDVSAFLDFADPQDSKITACNAGILGGWDTNFLREFSDFTFSFIQQNAIRLDKLLAIKYPNIIIEQLMVYSLSQKQKIPWTCLFGPASNFDDFSNVVDFENLNSTGFVHLLGGFKKYPACLDFLVKKLSCLHREKFYEIIDTLKASDALDHLEFYQRTSCKILNRISNDSTSKQNLPEKVSPLLFRELKETNPFFRTELVLSTFLSREIAFPANTRIKELRRAISSLAENPRIYCKDIFDFELSRLKFITESKSDYFIYSDSKMLELEIEEIFSHDAELDLEKSFVLNPEVEIVNTKWDWSALILYNWEEKLSQILKQAPGKIGISLSRDIRRLAIKELQLDNLNTEIFYFFRQSKTSSEAVAYITTLFDQPVADEDRDHLTTLITMIIKKGIYNGILRKSDRVEFL